jgi:hypothetical protein
MGPFLYRGENITQEFVQRIDEKLVRINKVLAIKVGRIVTNKYKRQFEKTDTCWICEDKFAIDKNKVNRLERKKDFINGKIKKYATEGRNADEHKSLVTTLLKIVKNIKRLETMNNKVWDHCHITGKFRGAAHNTCNLKLQIKSWKTPIPIVLHEFHNYDSHLICESVRQSVNTH